MAGLGFRNPSSCAKIVIVPVAACFKDIELTVAAFL